MKNINKKIVFVAVLFFAFAVSFDYCRASSTGVLSLNLPASIGAGQTYSVPLGLNVSGGMLGSWTVDVIMDPNYITVASGSDIAPGNVPGAFNASNYMCTGGSPPCDPSGGMQVTRVAGMTGSTNVTGSVILANLTFTGVSISQCGTLMRVVARVITDATIGAPATFLPMPTELRINAQASTACDLTPPSAPTGLGVQ